MVCISKCIAFQLWKRKGGVLDFTIFFLSERKIAFCCYQDTFAKKNNSKLALNPWIRIKCKLTAHNKWNFVKNGLDARKLKKGLSWHHCFFSVIQFYNKDIQSLQSKQITWLALVERRKRQLLGAKAF